MPERRSTWAISFARLGVLAVLMLMPTGGVLAADDDKYPTNCKGQWGRVIYRNVEVQGAFDQTKTLGPRTGSAADAGISKGSPRQHVDQKSRCLVLG